MIFVINKAHLVGALLLADGLRVNRLVILVVVFGVRNGGSSDIQFLVVTMDWVQRNSQVNPRLTAECHGCMTCVGCMMT